jgi:hypothetical protein
MMRTSIRLAILRLGCAAAVAGGCGTSSTALSADSGADGVPPSSTDGGADRDHPAGDVGNVADLGHADADPGCTLPATFHYGPDGGLVAFHQETILSPAASYQRIRTSPGLPEAPELSCSPALPACGDSTLLDISDVLRDLADTDVVAALAMSTPPLYGLDSRPTDGTMYQVLRADGHGFLAGPACTTGEFCHGAVPAGIMRLVTDLQALDQQQLADPSCSALR